MDFYTSLQGFGSESVERSTDAFSGSYSIKLITQDLVFDEENKLSFPLNFIAQGDYFYQIQTDSGSISKPFIKK